MAGVSGVSRSGPGPPAQKHGESRQPAPRLRPQHLIRGGLGSFLVDFDRNGAPVLFDDERARLPRLGAGLTNFAPAPPRLFIDTKPYRIYFRIRSLLLFTLPVSDKLEIALLSSDRHVIGFIGHRLLTGITPIF